MLFQELILRLDEFWARQGCVIQQPYDVEKGAGTMNPATFFRVLGPEPWRVAYVEPSRRPTDGRYGENPNRLQHYYQYQVILKPSPDDVIEVYLESLRSLGIEPRQHDIRFVEDNWESPTLGAWGLGWEVWLDGMEITQFTYFQQCGGYDLRPVPAEITYGLERIALFLQGVDNVFDIRWAEPAGVGAGNGNGNGSPSGGAWTHRAVTYGEIHHQGEVQHSHYNFRVADTDFLFSLFEGYEKEAERTLEAGLVLPAYDYVLKCSHTFNLLDARGAISVTERTGFIARIRALARACAQAYLRQREELGYPLLQQSSRSAGAASAATGA